MYDYIQWCKYSGVVVHKNIIRSFENIILCHRFGGPGRPGCGYIRGQCMTLLTCRKEKPIATPPIMRKLLCMNDDSLLKQPYTVPVMGITILKSSLTTVVN